MAIISRSLRGDGERDRFGQRRVIATNEDDPRNVANDGHMTEIVVTEDDEEKKISHRDDEYTMHG